MLLGLIENLTEVVAQLQLVKEDMIVHQKWGVALSSRGQWFLGALIKYEAVKREPKPLVVKNVERIVKEFERSLKTCTKCTAGLLYCATYERKLLDDMNRVNMYLDCLEGGLKDVFLDDYGDLKPEIENLTNSAKEISETPEVKIKKLIEDGGVTQKDITQFSTDTRAEILESPNQSEFVAQISRFVHHTINSQPSIQDALRKARDMMPKQPEKGIQTYKTAAENGSAEAHYKLGKYFSTAVKVLQKNKEEHSTILELSPEKAFSHLELAVTQGISKAKLALGLCFHRSFGVTMDKKRAAGLFASYAEWMERSMRKETSEYKFNVAYLCFWELGARKEFDKAEAMELLFFPASRGHREAQLLLGICYLDGMGVKINEESKKFAVYWLKSAAKLKSGAAELALAYCYFAGVCVHGNKERAAQYAKQGVAHFDESDPIAQCFMGLCLCHGIGVSMDKEKAFHWFSLSANGDYWGGHHWLGKCYSYSWGVKKDREMAVRLCKTAAQKGYAESQGWVSWALNNGYVKKNESEAMEWLKKASEQGLGHGYSISYSNS